MNHDGKIFRKIGDHDIVACFSSLSTEWEHFKCRITRPCPYFMNSVHYSRYLNVEYFLTGPSRVNFLLYTCFWVFSSFWFVHKPLLVRMHSPATSEDLPNSNSLLLPHTNHDPRPPRPVQTVPEHPMTFLKL